MRSNLSKLTKSSFRVYTGILCGRRYNRQLIKEVYLLNQSGSGTECYIGDHVLVASKPFKNIPLGSKVRFTGIAHGYTRRDDSKDFEIIVNKATRMK